VEMDLAKSWPFLSIRFDERHQMAAGTE